MRRDSVNGVTAKRQRTAGRPQSEVLDHAVLAAAVELLAEVGYEAMAIAEVARRAGTTTPAIYRRYSNKDALVLAALDQELAEVSIELPDRGSLRADLVALVEAAVVAMAEARTRILVGLVLVRREAPHLVDRLAATLTRIGDDELAIVVERAVARGELASGQYPDLLARVPGALVMTTNLMGLTPIDHEQTAQLVDQIMLPALRPALDGPRGTGRGGSGWAPDPRTAGS